MCRLLGFVSGSPTTLPQILGEAEFDRFTSLSCVHGDGWGVASMNGHGLEVRTSPLSAATDPAFAECSASTRANAAFVHLRWATDGLAVAPSNSHPFANSELALAHNGCIAPIGRLEAMLSDRGRAALRGDTDSERYFQFVVDHLGAGADECEGIMRAVRELAVAFPSASLNAMLLTASALYVVHVSSRAVGPTDELVAMFADVADIPHGHTDAYFQLAYREIPGGFAVVSSGLGGEGWTAVPPDCVLRIGRADGRLEILR